MLLGLLGHTLFGVEKPARTGTPEELWTEANLQAVYLIALKDAQADAFPPELLQEIRYSVRLSLIHIYAGGYPKTCV